MFRLLQTLRVFQLLRDQERFDTHFSAQCQFYVENLSHSPVDDLQGLLTVINRLAVGKDQKNHSLSVMNTDED